MKTLLIVHISYDLFASLKLVKELRKSGVDSSCVLSCNFELSRNDNFKLSLSRLTLEGWMIHMNYTLILVIMKLLIYSICQVTYTVFKIIVLIIKIKNDHRRDKQ